MRCNNLYNFNQYLEYMIDKLKVGINVFLILLVGGLLIVTLFVNNTNREITARVIDSPDNSGITSEIKQLSENLSFKSNNISYSFSQNCSVNQISRLEAAMKIIEAKVGLLNFYQTNETKNLPDIMVECLSSNNNNSKLGEGGPTLIAGWEILEGQVIFYNNSELDCNLPVVELHELLHVLGFIHTTKDSSIMYPIAWCGQEVDGKIIEVLKKEYS